MGKQKPQNGLSKHERGRIMHTQINANILHHPKTRRLMKSLKMNPREAVGLLAVLWLNCMMWAEDGDLSSYTEEDLAEALFWDECPKKLIDALLSSGFLELDKGGLKVKSWGEHTGKGLSIRSKLKEQNRQRQRKHRAKKNGEAFPEHLEKGFASEQEMIESG
tara:strand:+ start:275 stop:763 length:489 start_codon:yes stop_codon:yes gene_type:complete